MTPIADMVEAMLAQGVTGELIVLAIRAVECVAERDAQRYAQRCVTDLSMTPGAIRSRRYRENIKQNQTDAKANDVASGRAEHPPTERHAQRHGVTHPCNLSSSLEEAIQESKGSKKEVVARATRLLADMTLPDEWRAFAEKHGVDPETAFVEFKDYWIAVPGARGKKLDWFATWRNRVRDLPKFRGGKSNVVQQVGFGNSKGSLTDAAKRLAAELGQNRPGASGGAGGAIVRLLPQGGRE